MSKKRRDKERDSSSLGKVAKVGVAALAVGAGAASFNRLGLSRKLTSEVLPSIGSTSKQISKQARELKSGRQGFNRRLQANDIKQIANTHFKDRNTFKAEMAIRGNNRIKFDLDNKKNIAGQIINIKQVANNDLGRGLKETLGHKLQLNKTEELALKYKNKQFNHVKDLASNAYKEINENIMKDEDSNIIFKPDFLDKKFKAFGFDKQERQDFLTDILESKKQIEKITEQSSNYSIAKKQIEDRMMGSISSNKTYSNSLFGRVDKQLNKIGININSEQLLKGSRAATVDDFLNAYNKDPNQFDSSSLIKEIKSNYSKQSKYEEVNVIDIIKSLKENHDIGDAIFDKSLRVDVNGELFSTLEFDRTIKKQIDKASSTLPGKLFAGVDIRLRNESPVMAIMDAGSTSITSGYENINNSTMLMDSKIAIGNATTGKAQLFELSVNENGVLSFNENSIAEGHIRNNSHGKSARLTKEILGTNRDALETDDSILGRIFDIKQDGSPTQETLLKAFFDKNNNENYRPNILKRNKKLFTNDLSLPDKIDLMASEYSIENRTTFQEAKVSVVSRIMEDQKEISSMLNDLTASKQIDNQTITNLIQSGLIQNENSLKMLSVLDNKDYDNITELLQSLSTDQGQKVTLFNKDLENILNRGYVNIDHLSNMQNISQTKTHAILGMAHEYTNLLDAEDVIRRETVKEIMLREASEYSKGFNDVYLPTKQGMANIEKILQESNLDNQQARNLAYLSDWGLLQSISKLANDTDSEVNLDKLVGPNGLLTHFDNIMTDNSHFKYRYGNMLNELSARTPIFDSEVIGNINQNYYNEFNNYEFFKNTSLSRLNQVESINEAIKILGEAGKELVAGRHDLTNYTTLTQIPQFMTARLMWGVDAFGLGFSGDSTGSTMDLMKNIMLKRAMPIAGALALYDYMDYESENITGTSMTGAMANSLSNIDIATRRIADATGIGKAIDWFKETSVAGEYWTGSTDFQTAEERAEWYENGYTAVRGGRFWGFGSTSEFRGSNIQYYQPNYLRRAHSNWKEVGIYGSAEEKFKHSWMPSLRHPLSPLRAMWDPYWLEKQNMDERPYPLTGKLFTEGTPWGAVLNPTLGEFIKPVRMLPEIKQRLGKDGRDIRTVVEGINQKIKNRGKSNNDDLLILSGTDIRNASYTPYANTGDGYMNIQMNNGSVSAPGLGFMQELDLIDRTNIATGDVQIANTDLTDLQLVGQEFVQEMSQVSYDTNQAINSLVSGINNKIKELGARFGGYEISNPAYNASNLPDRTQGTYVYNNLVNKRNNYNSGYYRDNIDPRMIDKNLAHSYTNDLTHSMSQLSGIYGFLNDFAFGETSYKFEYANAGQMSSFSRHFWDAQAGGVGGGFMEIARRFFPSEDKSIIRMNPLKNSMPEWLPQRFLTGDAFADLPKGEMRLPGRGYETLHDLHSDQFGEYGAFDRFKILGDIAPTSEEFKLWRNIARNTVTDPNLIKEMEQIEERATKMSGKHEFYDYRYYNNNTIQKEGIVKSWNGNIVELASGEQLKLGGITLNQEADLSQFLQTGQKIHYRTSEDAIKRLEDGIVTNAVIYKKDGSFGTNINKELISMGMAERDKKDRSAIGYLSTASAMQQTLGAAQEFIGHANIPFIHNKYLKIETARESFINEHIYGTSFATWDNPIQGFIKPAFNQTFGQSFGRHLAAVGSSALYFNMKHMSDNPILKYGSGALMAGLNPTALLGMGVEFGLNLSVKALGGGSNSLNIERGAAIGSALGTVGWGLANAENPFKAAASFAIAGETFSKYFKMEDAFDGWGHGKGALVGAGVGLAISAFKNPNFSKEMFRKKWLPEDTEKKFEIDEYFDRLEYIKYKGLYNQAAMRAFVFEGNVNIGKIFKRIDKNKEKIAKLTRKAEKLSNTYVAGGYEYEQEIAKINNKIQALENTQTAFRGGKYTKAAVAYKKAMESTIYGISEGATADEILASVPVQYRDHYMAFMNERSEKERKKILKQLPEYLRKPLQVAWGEKPDKIDSNVKYFKKHAMPGMAWRGWKPNINLKHVKMKTIQNEGMLLSDFGYYESEKSKSEYHMAPDINDFDKGQGMISYLSNMTASMSGLGMSVQNISVEQTSAPGLWIAADVKQTANDISKVGGYAVNSGIQTLTSLLF